MVQDIQRIMVVDDNVDGAVVLAHLLECHGFETAVAHSGVEALAVARVFRPTVAILDLNMPRMDGFEAAHALRDKHSIRIVAYSADTTQATRERLAEEHCFDARLTKPASVEQMLAAIRGQST